MPVIVRERNIIACSVYDILWLHVYVYLLKFSHVLYAVISKKKTRAARSHLERIILFLCGSSLAPLGSIGTDGHTVLTFGVWLGTGKLVFCTCYQQHISDFHVCARHMYPSRISGTCTYRAEIWCVVIDPKQAFCTGHCMRYLYVQLRTPFWAHAFSSVRSSPKRCLTGAPVFTQAAFMLRNFTHNNQDVVI